MGKCHVGIKQIDKQTIKKLTKLFFLFTVLFAVCFNAKAQKNNPATPENRSPVVIDNLNISGQFYIAATYYKNNGNEYFGFNIRRSYLNVKYRFTDKLDFRYTQDLTIDNEGNDAGNIELRIKYLYLRYHLPDVAFFTNNRIKFGISQRPWLDFEEHINIYRVQGSMFLERSAVFNSAGFGIGFESLLGGKLDNAYAKKVKPNVPGKFGSIAMGLYNGGGYHQFEKNTVKNFEARVTVRPLFNLLPQLQFSYLGIFGTGNIPENPDFKLNSGFVSYQSMYLTLTAQYEQGTGNSFGTMINDSTFDSYNHEGYSLFGNFAIPKTKISVFSRYDNFTLYDEKNSRVKRYIGGISWFFYKKNKLVLSYQTGRYGQDKNHNRYDLALDISF